MKPIEAGVYDGLNYLHQRQIQTEKNMKFVLEYLGLHPVDDPDLVISNCQTDSNGAGNDPQQGTD